MLTSWTQRHNILLLHCFPYSHGMISRDHFDFFVPLMVVLWDRSTEFRLGCLMSTEFRLGCSMSTEFRLGCSMDFCLGCSMERSTYYRHRTFSWARSAALPCRCYSSFSSSFAPSSSSSSGRPFCFHDRRDRCRPSRSCPHRPAIYQIYRDVSNRYRPGVRRVAASLLLHQLRLPQRRRVGREGRSNPPSPPLSPSSPVAHRGGFRKDPPSGPSDG